MLDIHVWGPAFGLPSIDPECLALIVYLQNAPPSGDWRLVASNNPSVSPSSESISFSQPPLSNLAVSDLLPALHQDDVWVNGFSAIIKHLVSTSACADLDANLTPLQRADTAAYSSYLSIHTSSLLDLSLYVSAANWAAATRPAYSSLLPFPLTWTQPLLIRADAIARTAHLRLAELDSDLDPNSGLHITAGSVSIPESFRKHLPVQQAKKTVQDEMTPEQAAAIRLYSIAENCLGLLEEAMVSAKQEDGHPSFFSVSGLSSLDCLAFGYLALLLRAPVPRSFARDWMEDHAPQLCVFVNSVQSRNIAALGAVSWKPADKQTVGAAAGRLADSVIRHIPGVGDHYSSEMRRRTEEKISGLDSKSFIAAFGLLVTGCAAGCGAYYYRQLPPFGLSTQTWRQFRGGSRLSDFGQLGSMLNSAMGPPMFSPRASDLD